MTNTCAQCGRLYDPEKPHDCADRAHDHARLTEEVRTLRLLVAINDASQVPDGHTRINGKLFRLERHGELNRYGLVRVRPEENPDG